MKITKPQCQLLLFKPADLSLTRQFFGAMKRIKLSVILGGFIKLTRM